MVKTEMNERLGWVELAGGRAERERERERWRCDGGRTGMRWDGLAGASS
jgi:hypothetical protein